MNPLGIDAFGWKFYVSLGHAVSIAATWLTTAVLLRRLDRNRVCGCLSLLY